ncbi:MAG: hypothetical protein N2747_10345 [Chitinophagaceae bacterium]|nr:hypothetical protein [Chitinophagaceae bacterium]
MTPKKNAEKSGKNTPSNENLSENDKANVKEFTPGIEVIFFIKPRKTIEGELNNRDLTSDEKNRDKEQDVEKE